MAKKSSAKRIERLEQIVLGAGFLLKKLQAKYGADFGVGMEHQVRDCIRDCTQVERSRIQRQQAANARRDAEPTPAKQA